MSLEQDATSASMPDTSPVAVPGSGDAPTGPLAHDSTMPHEHSADTHRLAEPFGVASCDEGATATRLDVKSAEVVFREGLDELGLSPEAAVVATAAAVEVERLRSRHRLYSAFVAPAIAGIVGYAVFIVAHSRQWPLASSRVLLLALTSLFLASLLRARSIAKMEVLADHLAVTPDDPLSTYVDLKGRLGRPETNTETQSMVRSVLRAVLWQIASWVATAVGVLLLWLGMDRAVIPTIWVGIAWFWLLMLGAGAGEAIESYAERRLDPRQAVIDLLAGLLARAAWGDKEILSGAVDWQTSTAERRRFARYVSRVGNTARRRLSALGPRRGPLRQRLDRRFRGVTAYFDRTAELALLGGSRRDAQVQRRLLLAVEAVCLNKWSLFQADADAVTWRTRLATYWPRIAIALVLAGAAGVIAKWVPALQLPGLVPTLLGSAVLALFDPAGMTKQLSGAVGSFSGQASAHR